LTGRGDSALIGRRGREGRTPNEEEPSPSLGKTREGKDVVPAYKSKHTLGGGLKERSEREEKIEGPKNKVGRTADHEVKERK